jgi:hypothetical protein
MACDKHCPKMAIEATQMLANLFDDVQLLHMPYTKKGHPWKHSHFNHPCSKWVRQSRENALWLIDYARHLCAEKRLRWPRNPPHFCEGFLDAVARGLASVSNAGRFAEPPKCMPEKYIVDSTIQSYRNYYFGDKRAFATWRYSETPQWWLDFEANLQGTS